MRGQLKDDHLSQQVDQQKIKDNPQANNSNDDKKKKENNNSGQPEGDNKNNQGGSQGENSMNNHSINSDPQLINKQRK